jgi:hypothetical protein
MAITATLVPEEARENFLYSKLNMAMMNFEAIAFSNADRFCEEYNCAYWDFYELSNGGFFMAPALQKETVAVSNDMNYYSGECSPHDLGVIATMMGLCYVAERSRIDRDIGYMEKLAQYYYGLPDCRVIAGMLD